MPIDDSFLDEVGLGPMPAHERKAFLEHISSEFELRVGTALAAGLTDEQLEEFEAFIDRTEAVVRKWVASYAPDHEADPLFQSLAAEAPSEVSELAILSEYAALKWLAIHRPNYREQVAREMDLLRQEIVANVQLLLEPSE